MMLLNSKEQVNGTHCVKSVQMRSFSGPYFPAFGLNSNQKKHRIWTLFTQCQLYSLGKEILILKYISTVFQFNMSHFRKTHGV